MKQILFALLIYLPVMGIMAQESFPEEQSANEAFSPSVWIEMPLIEKLGLTEGLLNLSRPLTENEVRFLDSLRSDAENEENQLVSTTASSYLLLIQEQQELLSWENNRQSTTLRQQELAEEQDELKFNGFWVDVSTYSVLGVGIASLATSLVFSFLSHDAYIRYATTDQSLPRSSVLQQEYSQYELLSYSFAGGAILAAISYVSLEMARQ